MKKYRAFIYHNGNQEEMSALVKYYESLGFEVCCTMFHSSCKSLTLGAEKSIFKEALNHSFDVFAVLKREVISCDFHKVSSFVNTLECMGISCLSVVDGLLIRQVNIMQDFKYAQY